MCQNSEHPPNYSCFDEFFFALTTFDTDQADRWNRTFGLFKLVLVCSCILLSNYI